MPTHAEKKVLPYTPEELFNLVRDIEKYPEFLPWCKELRIQKREPKEREEVLLADMVVGFKIFRERFSSRVIARPCLEGMPYRIDVMYLDGPFKFLKNYWVFNGIKNGTEIDFFVNFEFQNIIMEKVIGIVFTEAVQKMVTAFEDRARNVYR